MTVVLREFREDVFFICKLKDSSNLVLDSVLRSIFKSTFFTNSCEMQKNTKSLK